MYLGITIAYRRSRGTIILCHYPNGFEFHNDRNIIYYYNNTDYNVHYIIMYIDTPNK